MTPCGFEPSLWYGIQCLVHLHCLPNVCSFSSLVSCLLCLFLSTACSEYIAPLMQMRLYHFIYIKYSFQSHPGPRKILTKLSASLKWGSGCAPPTPSMGFGSLVMGSFGLFTVLVNILRSSHTVSKYFILFKFHKVSITPCQGSFRERSISYV